MLMTMPFKLQSAIKRMQVGAKLSSFAVKHFSKILVALYYHKKYNFAFELCAYKRFTSTLVMKTRLPTKPCKVNLEWGDHEEKTVVRVERGREDTCDR